MSLITTANSGSASLPYAIRNIGGSGNQAAGDAVPCIQAGSAFGAIRIADPSGMVLVGGGIGGTPLVSAIRGGGDSGTTLNLGSSVASQNNIVLTDGVVTVNGDLSLAGGTSDLTVNGVATFNGAADFNGAVDMSTTAPSLRTRAVAGGAIPNNDPAAVLPQPLALSAGLYAIAMSCPGNEDVQANAIGYWNGAAWSAGASATATRIGGVGIVCVIEPVVGGASLKIYQNTGGALNVSFVYYTQLAAAFV